LRGAQKLRVIGRAGVGVVQSASSFRSCTAFAATFSAITIFIYLSLCSNPLERFPLTG